MSKYGLSTEDREHRLDDAANRYIHGEITEEEYRQVERAYAPDYVIAAQILAERRVSVAQEDGDHHVAQRCHVRY